MDWEGIPPTVDWLKEIEKGIEEADTFLAIVTPDWISSKICLDELDMAVKNGKRLIPVVPIEINWNDAPHELSHINYIFFRETDDFNAALDKLFTALDTDYDWLKTHRRLQVKALEWERSNKESGFLLHGKDLEEAEQQISVNATKDPHPTDIQREYVLLSRQGATRQRRITTGILVFIILMLVGISAYFATPRILDKLAQSKARGEMVLIPGGPVVFGTEDQNLINGNFPPRQIIPSLPAFQIGKYEVTNYQYRQCVDYGNCTVPIDYTYYKDNQKQNYPVVNVTLFQANTYCQWLGQRLPTQAEWERAVRGPEGDNWPWGKEDPTPDRANMPWNDFVPDGLSPVTSHPLGARDGIYNLIGNVWEWTSSFAEPMTIYDPTRFWNGDPNIYQGTSDYAQVGGGWQNKIDEVAYYSATRGTSADAETGIRCAANVK